MYFKYGAFQHRDNEAKLMAFFVRPRLGERNRRVSSIFEMHLQLELTLPADGTIYTTATAQAWLNNRISQVIVAYQDDFKDAIFYHDDGTPTRHSLTNGNSISGVRVKQRSWPSGDGAEYATTRTGYVVLQAEYPNTESQLYSYEETVISIGNGGPDWQMTEFEVGLPRRFDLGQRTAQRVIQTGRAVGFQGYPMPFIAPLYGPQFEHGKERMLMPGHPKYMGNGYAMYPIGWTFRFTLPAPVNSFPVIV